MTSQVEEKELEKKAPGEAEAENIPENGSGTENKEENAAGQEGASEEEEDATESGPWQSLTITGSGRIKKSPLCMRSEPGM